MEVASASAEARRFGKYTLVAKLATGGMAEIFLARLAGDGGFEKLVCIKRILPHLARDPQFVAMFLDEARVAARISHPNVCQVFELGEWQSSYFIAMEYLEGVPLSCLRRTDYYPMPPDPRLVAGIGMAACEGLHHAHQLKRPDGELLGVVHRDVSPQNLFVTIDGVVKVLDFGIAKVTDASSKTSTGAMKGTHAYMAPEQLRNEKLDRRTDVWAMGIVLWETLAQRHLFRRETDFLTFQAITSEPIPDICEFRPDVPPLLGDTINRALSRNREDRFASARALGEALAQAVAPLGGPLPQSAISDDMQGAFAQTLAEQHSLIRIAREGGHFDLDAESPLVGHGTQLATTPISNIQRRAEVARAEVASFKAVQDAIAQLDIDRTPSGFTPPPGYQHPQSRLYPKAATPASGVTVVPAPVRAAPSAKLPWIIALVAVAVAAAAGAMLYMKSQQTGAATTTEMPETREVVMKPEPAPSPPPVAEPARTEVVKVEAVKPETVKPETVKPETVKPEEPRPKPKSPPATPVPAAPHPSGPPGFITIDSAPVYAVIYVDGKRLGETPLVHISLAPGHHVVRAVSPSGTTHTGSIAIESGKTAQPYRVEW